jgi:manganese/zinc/iron transport system substrate-binding protein
VGVVVCSGCDGAPATNATPAGSSAGSGEAGRERYQVVATVSMVADIVRNVAGERAEVIGLLGAGVDPHTYKPTRDDVQRLLAADVVFYSGLVLEGRMGDTFAKVARGGKPVYAVTEEIDESYLLEPPEFAGHYDPHVWFDISLWSLCVETVVKGLSEFEPSSQAIFQERGKAARSRLGELHTWALQRARELPADRRILVTSHDAYNYFGRAYGFQVVALQGISTVSEASLADMIKLVEFIKQKRIKAVFVESSVSPATIQRISEDAGVKIGGELFSDAMGTPGQIENGYDLGTYDGMIKHNLNTIVDGLK